MVSLTGQCNIPVVDCAEGDELSLCERRRRYEGEINKKARRSMGCGRNWDVRALLKRRG